MTTSGSGGAIEGFPEKPVEARPAVTAKNYMPCAKVLPLHYSNIKSTRVAVFAIFLQLPPPSSRILLRRISAQSDKVRSEAQTCSRTPAQRTCCQPGDSDSDTQEYGVGGWWVVRGCCAEIIRCILITIQINGIIVIIPNSRRLCTAIHSRRFLAVEECFEVERTWRRYFENNFFWVLHVAASSLTLCEVQSG